MDVKDAIKTRRAYRSLSPVKITGEIINALGEAASLSPSCYNNQPWRYVFVYDETTLKNFKNVLSEGNDWARAASMIIAVFSKKENDCIIKNREYHQFDVGLATGFLILRATELGLVAHPIAGYDEDAVKSALKIPEDITVIALIIVGKHAEGASSMLSEKQADGEKARPARLPIDKIVHHNIYSEK